ncbi:MAG TPA: methyltransferase domain-containing protein [Verrucomicrobiae bacterium]|nr:methyltransferase domain-containing protein [Verrucomicrobiae bacterium]
MPSNDFNGNAIKINIGSGLSGISGWHNLDNSPTITLSRIPLATRLLKLPAWPGDVRRYDVRKGLPYANGSVRYIYSSHTFEHFTPSESLAVAKECFRVLARQGVLRIVVPDLELIAREYLADPSPTAAQTFLSRLSLHHSVQDVIHPGSNHSQMFDGRALSHLLREAGFDQVEVSSYGTSAIPEIDQIELEVRRKESLYVEARK